MLFEPFVSQVLGDDREDVNLLLGDVVEDAKIVHTEAILRLAQPAEPLDSSFASLAGLMPKVRFDGRPNARTVHCTESLKVVDGFGSKDDFISHSGQNVARNVRSVKSAWNRRTCSSVRKAEFR